MKAIYIDGVRFKHELSEPALSDALSGIQGAQAATNSLVGNLIKSRAAKDAIAESHFRINFSRRTSHGWLAPSQRTRSCCRISGQPWRTASRRQPSLTPANLRRKALRCIRSPSAQAGFE